MNKRLHKTLALGVAGLYCLLNPPFALADTAKTADTAKIKTTQVHEPAREDGGPAVTPPEEEKEGQKTDESPAETAEPGSVKVKTTQAHEPARGDGGPEITPQDEKEKQKINEFVTLSGLIEVDAIAAKDFAGADTSTVELATVELALDAKVTEWATGLVVIDYDSEDDDLYVDEANITLGKTEDVPLFLTAGKVYVPFGYFATNMIQDPLTHALGEINAGGVIGGFTRYGVTAELIAYKGMNETGDDDSVGGLAAGLTYTYEQDETALNTGIAWVNNIADAEDVTDVLDEAGIDTVASRVNGLRLHVDARHGAFALIGEYTTALDSFAPDELAFNDGGAQPAAWNGEFAYTTELLERETVFAAGYQGSREALALGLPEQRLIASAAMKIYTGTTVTLEYYLDQDYDVADGGTGEDGYGFTTRLAYAF